MGMKKGTKIKRKVGGKIKDIEGNRYGKLIVVEYTGNTKQQSSVWLCKCDCGKETFAQAHQLKRGYKKSCGCLKNKLSYGESSRNAVFRRYKIQAKKRELDFQLTLGEFLNLTKKVCAYCGDAPSQIYKRDNGHGEFVYNGIDRINSNKGYVKKNCVTSCGRCNIMKNNLTQKEFYSHIEKIFKRCK